MKIGIIREGKVPPDSRVPLTPTQCATINQSKNIEIFIAASPNRCYTDKEYKEAGIPFVSDFNDCEILMGVKEVPIDLLVPNKTYFFFSHTIKKQSYNRPLLKAVLEKNIRLLDYEVLTNDKGQRLIAFGHFAGMVGAHNSIFTYGKRTGILSLKRMKDCHNYAEALDIYKKLELPAIKIVLTGAGRVAMGAHQVLTDMGIRSVSPTDFLNQDFDEAVFTQLDCENYVARKDGAEYQQKDFFSNPTLYKSIFQPYSAVSDVMINGIYWDNKAPAFFTKEDMKHSNFKIKVIADVTCDIAPISSIPSTLKASTIADPIFGYNPQTEQEDQAHQDHVIDMMTIDNLPNELPRDASEAFGKQFITYILEALQEENNPIIERATVAANGKIGSHFQYLADWVYGVE